MNRRIIIASILRPRGTTGVHTSMNVLNSALAEMGEGVEQVTPFDVSPVIYYPAFGMRRAIHPVSSSAGVWWHRASHAMTLRSVLRRKLSGDGRVIVIANCPVSAKAALDVRDRQRHEVVLAVHFNISQADEWKDQGFIREGDWVWRSVRNLEKNVIPAVDRIMYGSDFMRRRLEEEFPALSQIPALSGFYFLMASVNPAPIEVDMKQDLVAVGSLESRKNQIFLLQVLRAARRLDIPTRSHLSAMAPI